MESKRLYIKESFGEMTFELIITIRRFKNRVIYLGKDEYNTHQWEKEELHLIETEGGER